MFAITRLGPFPTAINLSNFPIQPKLSSTYLVDTQDDIPINEDVSRPHRCRVPSQTPVLREI
jgi:hypothetical protein